MSVIEAVANFAALIATALAVSFLVPQILKLRRTGVAAGVSTTWAAIGAVTNAVWTAYLASAELWLAMVATGVATVLYTVTFRLLVRAGEQWRGPVLFAVLWVAALGSVALLGGADTLGVVLGLSYVVSVAPGVWRAYRTPDPAGISPGSWAIMLTAGPLWFFYGSFYEDAAVMIYAVTAFIAAALVLARYAYTRPRSPARADFGA